MNSRRQRPIAEKNNSVGLQRYTRYRKVLRRYKEAVEQGFYLEAVTLMESIISDRLESIINHVSNTNHSYSPLGNLIILFEDRKIKEKISDDFLTIVKAISEWKNQRNKALHEMAKLDDELTQTFETLYASAKQTAEEGYAIFRKVDSSMRNACINISNE